MSPDGRNVTLFAPLAYMTKGGELLTAPVGTQSDGASTPRIIWDAIPPFGRYWPACVIHDWLYRDTKRDKTFCDNVLYEAMLALGVDVETAKIIYEGVHLFGWKAFNDDRRPIDGALLARVRHLEACRLAKLPAP